VLKALDIVRNQDYCYVVTDYLPGKTLHQMIRTRGGIPEGEALPIFKAIVDGYSNLKKHKIIHRDLKPENIMFTADGSPVICDFGYS
jgi:serine/threonine protein kinase